MSDPLRIALVAEGPTDRVVLEAAITALLGQRSFVLSLKQPEVSEAFTGGAFGTSGAGWGGVYHWCRTTMERCSGSIDDDILFQHYDLLILHLDADVAGKCHQDANISAPINDGLPCEQDCPPVDATTNALRLVLLKWLNTSQAPMNVVLCTPSKSTEAWVMAALFPHDTEMNRRGWECHPRPDKRLSQQPLPNRIKKLTSDYRDRQPEFIAAWPTVASTLTEAERFSTEFLGCVNAVSSEQ